MQPASPRARAEAFQSRFGLKLPILEAPMAGANSLARAAAVANAGGMAALGAQLMQPGEIAQWTAEFRGRSAGPLHINLWIPEAAPARDAAHESAVRDFLAQWGPDVPAEAGDFRLPDFAAQCATVLAAKPAVLSSIMGIYPAAFVAELKRAGIAWFATATTRAEAGTAVAAGADAIIAQGFEAGGHRGAFDNAKAERQIVGTLSLVPRFADAFDVPIIAAGGIGDGRTAAAALTLGASAVIIGTALLAVTEAETPSSWADALARTEPEDTWTTRAFSGRLGRALATDYVRAAAQPDAPKPAVYPVQRGLTAKMRAEAIQANDVERMQAWAGQSAWMARREPAADFVARVWQEASQLLA